jgi:hypothetical protein
MGRSSVAEIDKLDQKESKESRGTKILPTVRPYEERLNDMEHYNFGSVARRVDKKAYVEKNIRFQAQADCLEQHKDTRVAKFFKPYKRADSVTHEERVEKFMAKLGIGEDNELRKAFGVPLLTPDGDEDVPADSKTEGLPEITSTKKISPENTEKKIPGYMKENCAFTFKGKGAAAAIESL